MRTMTAVWSRNDMGPMRRRMCAPASAFALLITLLLPSPAFAAVADFSHAAASGARCGFPGRPANGTAIYPASYYAPKETVRYECNQGFVLFGSESRECSENGTWLGEIPRCDFNIALGKAAYQSQTLYDYSPGQAVDGNPETCSFTPRGSSGSGEKWWQLSLGQTYDVAGIGITIAPDSHQEFSIFVVDQREDAPAEYRHCADFRGTFRSQKALFRCNAGLGQPGQFIYIRDERKNEEYFGLCEVEVFARRDRIPCGDPEQPVYSSVSKTEEQAVYGCLPGYRLQGAAVRDCLPNGQWSGVAPVCQEIMCGPPPKFPNAQVELKELRGGDWRSIAIYDCVYGYELNTILSSNPPTSKCATNGEWSTVNIVCSHSTTGGTSLAGGSEHDGIVRLSGQGSALAPKLPSEAVGGVGIATQKGATGSASMDVLATLLILSGVIIAVFLIGGYAFLRARHPDLLCKLGLATKAPRPDGEGRIVFARCPCFPASQRLYDEVHSSVRRQNGTSKSNSHEFGSTEDDEDGSRSRTPHHRPDSTNQQTHSPQPDSMNTYPSEFSSVYDNPSLIYDVPAGSRPVSFEGHKYENLPLPGTGGLHSAMDVWSVPVPLEERTYANLPAPVHFGSRGRRTPDRRSVPPEVFELYAKVDRVKKMQALLSSGRVPSRDNLTTTTALVQDPPEDKSPYETVDMEDGGPNSSYGSGSAFGSREGPTSPEYESLDEVKNQVHSLSPGSLPNPGSTLSDHRGSRNTIPPQPASLPFAISKFANRQEKKNVIYAEIDIARPDDAGNCSHGGIKGGGDKVIYTNVLPVRPLPPVPPKRPPSVGSLGRPSSRNDVADAPAGQVEVVTHF